MLQPIHLSHLEVEACVRKAKDTLFWPGMAHEIRDYIEKCIVCNQLQHAQPKQPMMSHRLPDLPWDFISMDLFMEGNANYLVMVDHYSDYWELCNLAKNTTSIAVVKACKEQFTRHGIPKTVLTDNGPLFTIWEFRSLVTDWNFEHIRSSTYYPHSNGKAEATVNIAK